GLPEQLAHVLRLDAPAGVDAAAGGERDHQRDGAVRPVLGERGAGKGAQGGRNNRNRGAHAHLLLVAQQSRSSRAGSRARCAAPPLHPCAPAVPTASSGKAILSCDTSTHTPPPARPASPMPSRAGTAHLPLPTV